MTRLLDKLEALDLIVREPDESDRRAHTCTTAREVVAPLAER